MFEDDTIYFTDDERLTAIFPYGTLASWRHQGKGPEYIKLGKRVGYRGSALNAFLESRTVRPTENAAA